MHPPLSISKILPPRFPHILERPRLLERLKRQSDKKLILILGQAAQGKSTLAFSYVNDSQVLSAWLNLGPEDSEAVNLFYLLVQSLRQALPELDLSPLLSYPTLPSGPREEIPLYRDWLLTLLNRIPTQLLIVLDGLDRLASQASAFRLLEVLLEVAPPHLHLLMLSREMPPLRLQELKIRQDVHLIGNDELAFTPKETRCFLQTVRQLLLPHDLIKRINEFTEGWIGGLILLCETLERLPEGAKKRFLSGDAAGKFTQEVYDYFEEIILSSRPAEVRELLIKSSILDIVDPDFIKEYLVVDNARDILEDLSARNLFVQPLFDQQKGWLYRYHQLFKDFLQARFREALAPEQQKQAYFRAGSLLEARGDPEGAVDYYLQAGATDRAVAAIEQIGLQLFKQAQTAELARWLRQLPPDLVQDRPWLLLYHFLTGRAGGAPECLASLPRAYALFQQRQDLRGLLLSLSHLIELLIFFGLPGWSLDDLLSQARELLQRAESRAWPYESAHLQFQVGAAQILKLNNRQGYPHCLQASLLARDAGDRHLEIQALINGQVILTAVGEFGLAQETNAKIEELLAAWNSPDLQTQYLMATAQLRMFRGEPAEAATPAIMALELVAKHGLVFLQPMAQFTHFMSLGYAGRYAEVVETGLNLLHHSSQPKHMQAITMMKLAIFHYHAGSLAAAAEFAAQARESMSAAEARVEYHLCFLRIVEGIIAYHRQEPGPAMERQLEEAVAELTGSSSYLFMADGHWVLALWRWRHGRPAEAAAHLKAGMAVAAQRGSYYSILLSPRDRGRIFTLALELGVDEVWDRLPPLLASLADLVEPDLVRLSRHANPKIAAKALELRRGLHRRGLPRLDIRTLGEFRLRLDQEPLDEAVWERKQPKLLLKALVARGSVNVPRDLLLEDLWAQGDPAVTERNFRVSLHRLRRAVEPSLDKDFGSSYLHMERGRLSLDRELCRVDVSEFLSLSESGRNQEEQGDLPQAIGLYKKAVALYGGDFLPEEPYLPWAEARRKELQAVYLELLERLSRLYEKRGTLGRAIDCCKKIIQTDPVSEPTYCRLMILYARRGRRREALRTYEACKEALARELETRPEAITTAIYRKIEETK